VTARAASIGSCALLVHAVAVDAATRAGVPGLLLRVAFRARLGSERRRAVRAVAACTGLVVVQTHGVGGTLWLVMTPHAGGGLSALFPECMAVLARRRLRSGVERRCDRRMAAFAQRYGWPSELAVAVAIGAGHLAEVRCVTRAIADVAVGDRHLVRRSLLAGRTARREHGEDDPPRSAHGFDPIGWHIRHGSALSGSLLDQPAGCGLPPTPPTL
jgi:hypothetical protein